MAGLQEATSSGRVVNSRSSKTQRVFEVDIRRRIRSVENTQQVTKAMSLPYQTLSDWSN
jgi:hypothetical protein